MILEQIPSKSKRHLSRNHFRNFVPKATASLVDEMPIHLILPRSKLLLINKSLQKFCDHQLIGTQYVQEYLLAQYRRNRSINTIRTYFCAIFQFFKFLKAKGCQRFEMISCEDLSAFIEHQQDLGLKPTTVFSRLLSLKAFFYYHIDADNIDPAVLKRKLQIKLPQTLPRAIDPEDIRQLLAVIDNVRNRALIVTLLRTGMRIGELLNTQMREVNLIEKRIEIYQAHKDLSGRVVYLSADAQCALRVWIKTRTVDNTYLFYGHKGRPLCYEAAREMFIKYLTKAGLSQKGYTLHCLRHTFASELLNAGMRLECLQQLLGHSDIEMTRRYARLTDNTRKKEYFKAMGFIERGQINGHYRRDSSVS
ncbi:tyrosine-type recombinase/integrase [Thermodesulfobacteriota bacterium]